jgi:hypothetical protein
MSYRRLFLILFGLVSAALCPGCTKYIHIEISGRIKSVVDGKPMQGVEVYYTSGRSSTEIDPLANGSKPDATTDANGTFFIATKESGSLPATMRLIVVKDGFQKETIDIRPQKDTASYETPVTIVVAAILAPTTAK